MSEFQIGDVVRPVWRYDDSHDYIVMRIDPPRLAVMGGPPHVTIPFFAKNLTLVRRAEPEQRADNASSSPACPHCNGTGLIEVWQYDTRCECAETEQKTDFPANTLRILRSPSLGIMKVGP